jgi:hypothetical protein
MNIGKEDFLGKLWNTVNSRWVWVWLVMSVALTVIDGITRGNYGESAVLVFPLNILIMTVIYILWNIDKFVNI